MIVEEGKRRVLVSEAELGVIGIRGAVIRAGGRELGGRESRGAKGRIEIKWRRRRLECNVSYIRRVVGRIHRGDTVEAVRGLMSWEFGLGGSAERGSFTFRSEKSKVQEMGVGERKQAECHKAFLLSPVWSAPAILGIGIDLASPLFLLPRLHSRFCDSFGISYVLLRLLSLPYLSLHNVSVLAKPRRCICRFRRLRIRDCL